MSIFWRLLMFIYNLILLALAGGVVVLATGSKEPMNYLMLAFASPQNRLISGSIGAIIAILALLGLIWSIKRQAAPKSVVLKNGFNGQVSITISAIKVIIMKAVKQVENVKDIQASIRPSSEGLMVELHMMVNPEKSVPELTASIQNIVKDYLEKIGGLEVAQIKVLVDDFTGSSK